MAFIGNISTELLFIYQLKNSNQIKRWLMRRGENWSTQRKNSWCRVKNQQTEGHMKLSLGTQATLVGCKGKC